MSIILINIIGIVIKVTLDIALNPNKFITTAIVTNTNTTISRSTFGKYIRTKLSAKVLITKAEIVVKYIHIIILNTFFRNFPPAYSEISIRSFPGNSLNTLYAKKKTSITIINIYTRFNIVDEPVLVIK